MRLALVVEYEGTDYHGFQYQRNAPSIQEELEKAVHRFTGEIVRIKGAGRTDAGVHAKAQVVAFNTDVGHRLETVVEALNHYLPEDIAVKIVVEVQADFDPRRMAVSRRYRYTIDCEPVPSPLRRKTTYHFGNPLNVRWMRIAAKEFKGVHDFARFAGPLDNEGASTTREVHSSVVRKRGEILHFEIEGNAFLPRQVRRMAGALVDVGRGRLTVEDVKSMVDGGPTGAVAQALPARGLCLIEIKYVSFP